MSTDTQIIEPSSAPRWRPLSAIERRVLGVLIEKAKTTPENYPLSLNSIRTGANQKSNRAPILQLEEDQVAEALEDLRQAGAVAEIQGGGRVDKYRHLAYEWLGVDKVELAVMAELLLRGVQTVGELRGRAARMEPIKDLGQLQPILDALLDKGLIVRLTPPGRGCTVTHALYLDHEMEKVRREASTLDDSGGWDRSPVADRPWRTSPQDPKSPGARSEPVPIRRPSDASGTDTLSGELHRLQDEMAGLRHDFQAVRAELEATTQQLRREIDELNRQLGN